MIRNPLSFAVLALCALSTHALADGQGVPINYDNLSFFEEPLAAHVGPATVSANLLFDQAAQYNTRDDRDSYNTRINGDFMIETELSNSWQVGARYVANYDRLEDNDELRKYVDNLALFAEDEWGTVAVGNVTGSVRETVRRKRGFGNSDIKYDGFVGELDETGAFYSIDYNAFNVAMTADQEGRAEVGLSFEQPFGTRVWSGGVRLRKGDVAENLRNGERGDTYGATAVGSYIYASTLINGQIGYENVDDDNARITESDHVFGSVGMQYKYGAYRFSADGVVSEFNDETRRSVALGSRIDFARGASVNLGLNYEHDGTDEDLESIASVRYEM